ncbi:MAG: tyrosine-type recombinase/integrase [Planctomycetota bacterium]|jgi:integrase
MKNLPVSQAFQVYLQKSDLADNSIELKSRAVDLFVKSFGNLPVEGITPEMAAEYKRLSAIGRSRSAANFYLANISPFFGWLDANSHIERNPFKGIRRFAAGRKVRLMFSGEEINRILVVADARWQTIVRLSCENSLRRGEVLNVCRDDIDGKWLHIQPKKQTARTWPWRIKNHAEALLLLSEPLQDAITKLLVEVPLSQPYIVVEPKMYRKMIQLQNENSLGHRAMGCPFSNFNRSWRQLLKRAWVSPTKRFQDLRASFCTALLNGGMRLDEVSKVMRHSTIATTTQFYARYDAAELAAKSQEIIEKYYASNVP